MSELNTEQLLRVYRQTILEQGLANYPDLSRAQQIVRGESDFLSYLREDFFPLRGAFYCLWIVNNRYVSALRFEPYRDGLLLEALETEPDERERGYAFALVSDVLSFLKNSDFTVVYSHIAKKNNSSIRLHQKCGFQRISDSATLINGSVSNRFCTMAYNLK